MHQIPVILVDVFERLYSDLSDSEDAVAVFGHDRIQHGVATVGDIRKMCRGKSKDAEICIQSDGWGLYVKASERKPVNPTGWH